MTKRKLFDEIKEGMDYLQKVREAPYHPGYEDAVIVPEPVYKGVDPAKMLWKPKPLSNDEILEMTIWNKNLYELYVEMEKEDMIAFARAIEERHGIK